MFTKMHIRVTFNLFVLLVVINILILKCKSYYYITFQFTFY